MAQPTAPSPEAEELEDLTQMEALATKHGYLCQKKELWLQEFSTSIASRMVPRLGDKVYQMMRARQQRRQRQWQRGRSTTRRR